MKAIVSEILAIAQDTEDPVDGSVFEKMAHTDAAAFDAFMNAVYRDVDVSHASENGRLSLYYSGNKHVGTYVVNTGIGYFGGSRVGSKNPWRKPGDPEVDNSFEYPEID